MEIMAFSRTGLTGAVTTMVGDAADVVITSVRHFKIRNVTVHSNMVALQWLKKLTKSDENRLCSEISNPLVNFKQRSMLLTWISSHGDEDIRIQFIPRHHSALVFIKVTLYSVLCV